MNFKTARGAIALASALTLAACATTPPERQTAGTRPERQAAGPRLDRQAEGQAQAFEAFMRKAGAIDAGFSGPAEVTQALGAGAAYEPRQLEAGMIAYAAMAALEEPRFVAGVRKSAQGREGQDLASRLAARPDLADDLPGGSQAAARASAALYRQGETLGASGRKVKSAAYSIQHQAWANSKVADPRGRLARVKQNAVYRPDGDDRARLYKAVAQGGARGGPASPVVQRGLALAALTVLGQDGKARGLMSEPRSEMCLRMAKLNFHQCLASAGPYYEDIYCLGLHAMIDPGQCVTSASQARGVASR
ncbi:MAG TPA: hypothetical protein VFW47_04835 [Phenylobacterium sp.]|nr:hypothetical protein [Phenylobacterium sp.]